MSKRKTFVPDDEEAMRLGDEAAFNWGACRQCGDLYLLFTLDDMKRRYSLCRRCQTPVDMDDQPLWLEEKRWVTP